MIHKLEQKPSLAVIEAVQDLLDHVKSGEVRCVIYVAERADKTIDWCVTGGELSKFELAGYMMYLAHHTLHAKADDSAN